MLSAAQIQEFRECGYLKVGRVMSDEGADRLREQMFQVIEGKSKSKPELLHNIRGEELEGEASVIQIVDIWQADDFFHAHVYNPVICEMACELIGTDTLRVWHDQVLYKPPRKGGTMSWHQDHPCWPIIQPADLVSASGDRYAAWNSRF